MKAPRLCRYIPVLAKRGVNIRFYGFPPDVTQQEWPEGIVGASHDSIAQKASSLVKRIFEPFGFSSIGRYVGVHILCMNAQRKKILDNTALLFTQPYMYPVVKAAKKRGIPVVLESDSDYPTYMWRQLNERRKINNLPFRQRDPWNFWPYVKMTLKSIELADKVVVFGDHAYTTFVDAGIAPEKLHKAYPPPSSDCRPAPEAAPEPEFIWSGNHGVRKGIDLVEQAWERYKSEGGRGTLHLCGSASVSQKEIRKRLGLLPDVVDHGQVDLIAFLGQKKRVFLSPSFSEGLPRSVTEAMACGNVIIGSFAGTGGLLEEDKNGWLVDLSADDLLRGLRVAADNWHKIDEMGDYAVQSVHAKTGDYFDSVCGMVAALASQSPSTQSK